MDAHALNRPKHVGFVALDHVLGRLRAHGRRVKQAGDECQAQCPAHEDDNPSLSVREDDDGRVLLHCHAGCSVQAIVHALGLTQSDLFPPKIATASSNGVAHQVPNDEYLYSDANGMTPFKIVKHVNMDGKKRFVAWHRDREQWKLGMGGVRPYLFRQPELACAPLVVIVEGEKCALAVAKLGMVATTNPFGAGKWRPQYTQALSAAKRIIILADCDRPGRDHARKVAESVRTVCPKVDIADLDSARTDGYDIYDAIADGTITTAEQIIALADKAASSEAEGVKLEWFDSMHKESIEWAWTHRISVGLTVLFGAQSGGKTRLSDRMAADFTNGLAFPGDTRSLIGPCKVGLLSYEDPTYAVTLPVLELCGARLDSVCIVRGKEDAKRFALTDLDELEKTLLVHPDLRVFIIDPIDTLMRGRDSNKKDDVRAVLDMLSDFALEHRLFVICIGHPNKATRQYEGEPMSRLAGSTAFGDAPRSVFVVAVDKQTGKRCFASVKWSLAPFMPPTLTFDIKSVDGHGVAEWGPPIDDVTADSLLAPVGDSSSKVVAACAFLRAQFKDGRVRMLQATTVGEAAQTQGIKAWAIVRARTILAITDKREKAKQAVRSGTGRPKVTEIAPSFV